MKRYALIFLISICLMQQVCIAQNDSLKKEFNTTLSTNLLGPFSLALEFKTGKATSLYFSPRVMSLEFFGRTTIFSLTTEVRIYNKPKNGLHGFYVAPYLKYRYRQDSDKQGILGNELNAEAYFFGGGMVAGYQLILRKGFLLNFYAGPGYTFLLDTNVSVGEDDYWDEVNTLDFRTGLGIGFAF